MNSRSGIPDAQIEAMIFGTTIDLSSLDGLDNCAKLDQTGGFHEIDWLNTPGPVYTTFTDNCGTGQLEAPQNVSGDLNYHEFVFKQPTNILELRETVRAAWCDPFGAYFIDGNANWNRVNVAEWWSRSDERVNFILELYAAELELPDIEPHKSSWKIEDTVYEGQLFGPPSPVPENYRAWLDFYQFGMKEYLEWYVYKISQKTCILPELTFNWTLRNEIDRKCDQAYETKRSMPVRELPPANQLRKVLPFLDESLEATWPAESKVQVEEWRAFRDTWAKNTPSLRERSHDALYIKCTAKGLVPKNIVQVGANDPEVLGVLGFIYDGCSATLFEPDPSAVSSLRTFFRNFPNVTIFGFMLSDRNGTIRLHRQTSEPRDKKRKRIHDAVTRMEQHDPKYMFYGESRNIAEVDDGTIDLLSIDAEGYEDILLKSMRSRPNVISLSRRSRSYDKLHLDSITKWMKENAYENWFCDKLTNVFVKNNTIAVSLSERVQRFLRR